MRTRPRLGAFALTGILAAPFILGACDTSEQPQSTSTSQVETSDQDVVPALYGQRQTCFVTDDDDQREIQGLIDDGICEPGWPIVEFEDLSEEEQGEFGSALFLFWGSDPYRSKYVSPSRYSRYDTYRGNFQTKYPEKIERARTTAQYVDRDGNIIPANKVKQSQIAGGIRNTVKGNARGGATCAAGPEVTTLNGEQIVLVKASSSGGGARSSGGGGGGYSGGSARSSSSSSSSSNSGNARSAPKAPAAPKASAPARTGAGSTGPDRKQQRPAARC